MINIEKDRDLYIFAQMRYLDMLIKGSDHNFSKNHKTQIDILENVISIIKK